MTKELDRQQAARERARQVIFMLAERGQLPAEADLRPVRESFLQWVQAVRVVDMAAVAPYEARLAVCLTGTDRRTPVGKLIEAAGLIEALAAPEDRFELAAYGESLLAWHHAVASQEANLQEEADHVR